MNEFPSVALRCSFPYGLCRGTVRFTWNAPANIVWMKFTAADVSRTPHLDFSHTREWNGNDLGDPSHKFGGIFKHGDTWIVDLERGRSMWRILRRGGWKVPLVAGQTAPV